MLSRTIIYIIIICNIILSQNTISGFITDKESGEALIGASVFIKESNQGMASEKNGYYYIKIDDKNKNVTIIVQYIGYEPFQKKNYT